MPFDTNQQKWLPLGLNSQDTGIPFPDLGKVHAAEHRFRYLQPLLSSYDQHSCGKHLTGRSSCEAASRKRFLVFDQSGNETRLLQCGFLPSKGTILEKGLSKDCAVSERILLHEEESEMHEDTEEINALLYSDDDCESDDEEVMSTGHSPFEQACNKTTREEVLDETESSDDDDGPRRKRQKKLLDHSYKDPSPSLVGTITKLKGHDSNISSSKQQETGSGLSDEQSRKDKIHTALRILESVVPGAKGKEALLLLDEAIDYLKLLKRDLNYNHW